MDMRLDYDHLDVLRAASFNGPYDEDITDTRIVTAQETAAIALYKAFAGDGCELQLWYQIGRSQPAAFLDRYTLGSLDTPHQLSIAGHGQTIALSFPQPDHGQVILFDLTEKDPRRYYTLHRSEPYFGNGVYLTADGRTAIIGAQTTVSVYALHSTGEWTCQCVFRPTSLTTDSYDCPPYDATSFTDDRPQ